MTPIAVILAAALGVGQVPTQEPSYYYPLPTGGAAGGIVFSNDYVTQAKGQTGAEKPTPCCDKDCPCPFACMGKKTSDDDYAWLNDALDALSDTAEVVGDVLSNLWPFQTFDASMTLPEPHYLEHPPLAFAPSPPFPLVPQEPAGHVKMQYQVEEQGAARPVRILIQGGAVRSQLPAPVPVGLPTVGWQIPVPQMMQSAPPSVCYPASVGMPSPPPLPYPPGYMPSWSTVPPTPVARIALNVVPKGDHHVLAISQGETTLVCKKTTIEVAHQDLVFTTGPSRVHVHGRSFEASATKITTQTDDTLLLEGDVHLNCDDHGKAMVYKGSKAVVELKGDQVNLVVGGKR